MKIRFNADLLLWAIGVLQPTTPNEARTFLAKILTDVPDLPTVEEIEDLTRNWQQVGVVYKVCRQPDLYSLTSRGNRKLPVKLKWHRDRIRLFLLKEARSTKLKKSGAGVRELAGVAPAVDVSTSSQEGTRPIVPAATTRPLAGSRDVSRNYWPRVYEQLSLSAGSENPAPDVHLKFYSYGSIKSLRTAQEAGPTSKDITAHDLALAIGVSPRLITAFIHAPNRYYRTFSIGKRGGGTRTICSPKIFLKVIQYWILDYMLNHLRIHQNCHSYQKGKSILTNALPHVSQPYVANIDIENFFGSVRTSMVMGLLRRNKFGEECAKNVSRLLTLNDALPQGAPTSPTVSNAYLFEFDKAATKVAMQLGLMYTRYADDITISGRNKYHIEECIERYKKLLSSFGLSLNDQKTRIASRSGQQRVTGIVVNTQATPPRKLRRKVRAMLHNAEKSPNAYKKQLLQLRGYVSFLKAFPHLADGKDLRSYEKILGKISK